MVNAMTVSMSGREVFGARLTERINRLNAAAATAAQSAAAEATRVTRDVFASRPDRRVGTPGPRPGRPGTQLDKELFWSVKAGGSEVVFDQGRINSSAPFWIIQEIGTGESAVVRQGGDTNPQGRPAIGASYVRTVPSQRGRLIPGNLVFATPGGAYTPAGGHTGEQLFLRSQIKGAPKRGGDLVISKEIEGKHFVQRGAREGFLQYRTSVLAAARQAFAGQKFSP